MRRWLIVFVLALGIAGSAQQMMPVGVTRGSLVSTQSGVLSVRHADGALYSCAWDSRTLFTRHDWPIHAADLNDGEPVEVLSDRSFAARGCYARILTIVEPSVREKTNKEHWMPRGNLTFAGQVVDDRNAELVIKTREGTQILHIRPDTKFSGDGIGLSEPGPLVNRHVFIRGGRTLYGVLEAYQVMWGEILLVP